MSVVFVMFTVFVGKTLHDLSPINRRYVDDISATCRRQAPASCLASRSHAGGAFWHAE